MSFLFIYLAKQPNSYKNKDDKNKTMVRIFKGYGYREMIKDDQRYLYHTDCTDIFCKSLYAPAMIYLSLEEMKEMVGKKLRIKTIIDTNNNECRSKIVTISNIRPCSIYDCKNKRTANFSVECTDENENFSHHFLNTEEIIGFV